MEQITLYSALGAIVLISGAFAAIWKMVRPAIKLSARVEALERHEKKTYQAIEDSEKGTKLLCKAMIALVDNRITGNSIDGLKMVKSDLLDYLTGE